MSFLRAVMAFTALLFIASQVAFAQTKDAGPHPSPANADVVRYLKAHWQSPEDYVVAKFKDHDVVFLGEYHRIKHDPELVQALIPRLYKAGVYNLGFEFGVAEDQAQVDRLVTAPTYDPALARMVLFHGLSTWGYKEYLDVYRAAWQLNHSLLPGAPRFRIVHLMYRANWPALKGERTPEVMRQVWTKGDPDTYMADVVLREFVDKKQKALVYCGIHHAFTRYHQPIFDFEQGKLLRKNGERMGNLIFAKIGDRAMTIYLHAPWVSSKGWDAPAVRPAGGAIDEVMVQFAEKRVGFDLVGTAPSALRASDTYYSFGYDGFKLSDFADGYVYQKPFREYQGVTVDPEFITTANLQEAIDYVPNPAARTYLNSPERFAEAMQQDANIPRRIKHLQ